MTLEDKFGAMGLNGPLEIEIEGEPLELDVDIEDVTPLMSMGGGQGGADISEEDVEKLTDTFRTILYRSYLPYWDEVRSQEPNNLNDARQQENDEAKEYLDGLLVRKLPVLINKVVEELGWADGDMAAQGDFPEGNLRQ